LGQYVWGLGRDGDKEWGWAQFHGCGVAMGCNLFPVSVFSLEFIIHIFSVSSAASQPEYDPLDSNSASHMSESFASPGLLQDETSQFGEYLDNITSYGQMGVTQYETTFKSQKMLKNTPSGLARMGRGRPKMVLYIFCVLH